MKPKLKDYYRSIIAEGKFDEASKAQFREDIKAFGSFGNHIYNTRGMNEVSEAVKGLAERASAMALDEAGDWFDAVTVKKNMNEVKKDAVLFEKTAKEMGALQQRLESLYEDMAQKLGRYYEVGELAGKSVLPADNDYTANGEEEEEMQEQQNFGDMIKQALSFGNYHMHEQDMNNTNTPTTGGFKMDTGNQLNTNMNTNMNQNQAANTANQTPGQNLMPLGDLMSDDEIKNVKENYWTLQGAQKSLMEDDEGASADEGAPGIAVNKSTEWKARNESRADFFTRMKEILEK